MRPVKIPYIRAATYPAARCPFYDQHRRATNTVREERQKNVNALVPPSSLASSSSDATGNAPVIVTARRALAVVDIFPPLGGRAGLLARVHRRHMHSA